MKIPETGVLLIHFLLTLRERYQLGGLFFNLDSQCFYDVKKGHL